MRTDDADVFVFLLPFETEDTNKTGEWRRGPWSVRLTTNPLMAATNIAYQAPERRRLSFHRIVRDIVFGMLPPVATIILVALAVLVFSR